MTATTSVLDAGVLDLIDQHLAAGRCDAALHLACQWSHQGGCEVDSGVRHNRRTGQACGRRRVAVVRDDGVSLDLCWLCADWLAQEAPHYTITTVLTADGGLEKRA